MGNVHISPSDSEMLHKLDPELDKKKPMILSCFYLVTLMPGIQFVIKALNKNGKILEDMSRHNVQIQNEQN